MTISELINEVNKVTPHNAAEVKFKMLMPTYRFVTSANFALIAISIVILLTSILVHNSFAYSQDVIDKNGIKDIKVHDLSENTRAVSFDYCLNKYSIGSVGALVVSDLDAVPVPIDSKRIKYKECAIYGTRILAESDKVTITLFQEDALDTLISSFNAKIHDLKNKLTQLNQKINENKKLNDDNDKIYRLTQKAQLLELQIKSAQSSLKTVIAMNDSS